MKKATFVIFLAVSFFMFHSASAQDDRREVRENIQERMNQARALLTEERKKNIRRYFSAMSKRIDAAIFRLERLSQRISSRIEKMEAGGRNLSEAKAKLFEADIKIEEVKSAFTSAKEKLETALNSDNPRESFAEVREGLAKGVIEKIKQAHQALVESIAAIKNTQQQ